LKPLGRKIQYLLWIFKHSAEIGAIDIA